MSMRSISTSSSLTTKGQSVNDLRMDGKRCPMYPVPDCETCPLLHRSVLIVGQSPSTRRKIHKNSTVNRLIRWCDVVGIKDWDFHNIIPDIVNCYSIYMVDLPALQKVSKGRKKIIALGGLVAKTLTKYNIPHYKIDHPSPRNRNLNDPKYERKMLKGLKVYLET
jgi:hypothetical protein